MTGLTVSIQSTRPNQYWIECGGRSFKRLVLGLVPLVKDMIGCTVTQLVATLKLEG